MTTYIIILLLILTASELAYIKIAKTWIPKAVRNDGKATVIGGGIIFYLAAVASLLVASKDTDTLILATVSALPLCIIGYMDDLNDTSPLLRLAVQVVVSGVAMLWILPISANIIIYIVAVIILVGSINAYNFMDGICGMLAMYSIVVCSSIAWLAYSTPDCAWLLPLSVALAVAAVVFGWFNIIRRDSVYCGDVGSTLMGFFIGFMLISIGVVADDISIAVFVAVYIVDVAVTLCNRIIKGENILQPHKSHLYQLLDSRSGGKHIAISSSYAIIQAAINIAYFIIPGNTRLTYFISVYIGLTLLRILLNRKRSTKNA